MSLDFNDFAEDAVLDEFALSKAPLGSVVYFPEGTEFDGFTVTEALLVYDPVSGTPYWALNRGYEALAEEATSAEIAELRPRRAPYLSRKVGLCLLLNDNEHVYTTVDYYASTPLDAINVVMETLVEDGYHTVISEDGSARAIIREQVKEVRAYYA